MICKPLRSGAIAAGAPLTLLAAVVIAAIAWPAAAQDRTARPVGADIRLTQADADGPAWRELGANERAALAPLQREWDRLDGAHKARWLDLAARFAQMDDAERTRLQGRMAAWARLTPAERARARLHYQAARKVAPEDRQAKWEVYQKLPEDQRRKLAGGAARRNDAAVRGVDLVGTRRSGASSKLNIVADPARAERPRQVAPAVVQARPGATTNLLSAPATPPRHQQPGLQKIAAEPGFIDPETLLPRRGPQGAAAIASPKSASRPAGRP